MKKNKNVDEVLKLNNSIVYTLLSNRRCGYTTSLETLAKDGRSIVVKSHHHSPNVDKNSINITEITNRMGASEYPIKYLFDADSIMFLCEKNRIAIESLLLENEELKKRLNSLHI